MKSNLSGILAPLASSYPDIMDAIATNPIYKAELELSGALTAVVVDTRISQPFTLS
jgi:hypothetical protein